MARANRIARAAVGALAVCTTAVALGVDGAAEAAKSSKGGVLSVRTIGIAGRSGVHANEIVEVEFNTEIDPSSVGPATVQVRARNATGTGYTKQVFGTFQAAGRIIRFFPRLPGHLRDANGKFYTEGLPQDDAAENAGFQPATDYQVTLIGRPEATTIRAATGRPLKRSQIFRFSTASNTSADMLYTTTTYSESPPPQYSFSNPPDTVPVPATQFTTFGGTAGVPNDILAQLYCTRVPLSPATARVLGNVTLTMLARNGNYTLRRPVEGSVYVEQNVDTTLLVYKPRFPLADKATYSLRVSKNVKDLTEQYDFLPNRDRERLRQIYDALTSSRANSPGTPAADLADPPSALIGDWPPATDTAARGVLKANILALGDAYPDEFDPRTMIIFTTRDEPITNAEFRLEFLKSEGLFDATVSTGEWDVSVPGAASAIFTVAGGSAVNGDFTPTSNTTLNAANYPSHEMNFRDVLIPQGVTVTLTGTRPVTIKAINFTLNGTIEMSGSQGQIGQSGNRNAVRGGAGGPGGGAGADSNYNSFPASNADLNNGYAGLTGKAGVDTEGNNPTPFGGQGGLGGKMATSTYYMYGGGGGGGGARLAGKNGGNGTGGGGTFGASWNGAGGAGGAAAAVQDLNPLFGGAGGGSGGNGGLFYNGQGFSSYSWYGSGSGGGGGGGAIMIQTARTLTIGSTGLIRAIGGNGNSQVVVSSYYGSAGPGGGGGGGSVLLRSSYGFNIANPTGSFNVNGGAGGAGTGSYPNRGGDGGAGFIRTEDPNGGITLPNGGQGTFDPVGAGVPSFVYSKWADLGVQDPRILAWTKDDIATDPTTNDAIYVQVQMTREDPSIFGQPDESALDKLGNSTNTSITSQWLPIKIHDRTGLPGQGAFTVPGYDPAFDGSEFASFPITALNGLGLRFIRFRIFFQLDQTQRRTDPIPNVDYIITHYQYNL